MTRDFRERDLIVDEDVAHYDGTTAVVRTEHLPAPEIEFLRWRAERWMKLSHMPATFRHSPGYVMRHGLEMLRHTFTGTTMRSLIGLEDDHAVFERFRQDRRRRREQLLPDIDSGTRGSGTRTTSGALKSGAGEVQPC